MKDPERNQERKNARRPIPSAFGVQKAVRFTIKRQEKLINQLSSSTRKNAAHWLIPCGYERSKKRAYARMIVNPRGKKLAIARPESCANQKLN